MQENNGFDKDNFLLYLESQFNGFDNPWLRSLVNNVIDFGLEHEQISKDQLAYWLSDMLPEVEFGEVAVFCNPNSLTENGLKQAEEFKDIL